MGSSAVPSSKVEVPLIRHPGASRSFALVTACVLAAFALLPTLRDLMQLWQSDALRSVGAYLVLLAVPLILYCWSRIGWESSPSSWGFPLVLAAAFCSYLTAGGWIVYRFSNFIIQVLQPGLLLFVMGMGIVLLFGGWHLLRTSIFPLCLLLLANPIPHTFNIYIDLPLQQLSANTARHFAHLLGLHPSGEDLLMMFTPHFGMMIVPGCNGIRGSLTLFYLALILAWLEHFRPWKIALCAVGALALGYLLNLLRLCLLVLYYWAGTHIPTWQHHGEAVDYAIGGAVFLAATALFTAVFFRRKQRSWYNHNWQPLPFRPAMVSCALLLLLILSIAQVYLNWGRLRFGAGYTPLEQAHQAVPVRVGAWKLQKTWAETDSARRPVLLWAEYTSNQQEETLQLGLWLSPTQHFAVMSEQAHGRTTLWTSSFDTHDRAGHSAHFSTFASADPDVPNTLSYTAETSCRMTDCVAHIAGFNGHGWSFAFANAGRGKHLQMEIKIPEASSHSADLTAATFVSQLDTASLVSAAGTY